MFQKLAKVTRHNTLPSSPGSRLDNAEVWFPWQRLTWCLQACWARQVWNRTHCPVLPGSYSCRVPAPAQAICADVLTVPLPVMPPSQTWCVAALPQPTRWTSSCSAGFSVFAHSAEFYTKNKYIHKQHCFLLRRTWMYIIYWNKSHILLLTRRVHGDWVTDFFKTLWN